MSGNGWHLDAELADAYVRGDLPGQAAASVDAHLPTCHDCRRVVAAATDPTRLESIWAGVAASLPALSTAAVEGMEFAAPTRRGLSRREIGIVALAVAVLAGSFVRVVATTPSPAPVVAAPTDDTSTRAPSPEPSPPSEPIATASELAVPEVTDTLPPTPPPPPVNDVVAAGTTIEAFDGCASLESHLREEGLARVTAWGLPGMAGGRGTMEPVSDSAPAPAAAADGVDPPSREYSDTNVQEAGVDEPDLLETNGSHAFVWAGNAIETFAVADGTPARVSRLDLGDGASGSTLLLWGSRLLVLTPEWHLSDPPDEAASSEGSTAPAGDSAVSPSPAFGGGTRHTVIRLVDVSDPAAPKVLHSADVEGWLVSSRSVDGIARVVVRSHPSRLPFVYPDGDRSEEEAQEHNRQVVADSTIDQWQPRVVVSHGSEAWQTAAVAPCERTVTPSEFAGFGSLSVLTVDLNGDLGDLQATTILTGGEVVYASKSSLYVATTRWYDPARDEPVDDYSTDLHTFDISSSGPAAYRASGGVPGYLLNQFSISEFDGHLRVATTQGAPWTEGTTSGVYVLQQQTGTLGVVGSVGGLGQGERIYAVRFMGPVAYLVTFRQIDPLYTLDLRDPSAPRVVGELKIPGYSAYLHPVGAGALLGLGQDATEDGQVTGTQLSLFDVSDLATPRQQSKVVFAESGSEAEWDHLAFLYWEPTGLVMVPLTTWSDTEMWSGAVAIRLADGQLTEVGRIEHPEQDGWLPPVRRTFVAGGSLFTVSDQGIQANELGNLEMRGFQAFGG